MGKDKIRTNLTRGEAADRLAQLAEQLRNGTISLGEEDEAVSVPDDVRLKADLDDDKLEVELKWEEE
ncbi:MAG TPA: amphi-Trp domain-containing protein [Methyloceanibacter sp.]|nr:amphi-Trp domain-containing protein [Methyloceanibacter sp.]